MQSHDRLYRKEIIATSENNDFQKLYKITIMQKQKNINTTELVI